jgi:hypothetical protein
MAALIQGFTVTPDLTGDQVSVRADFDFPLDLLAAVLPVGIRQRILGPVKWQAVSSVQRRRYPFTGCGRAVGRKVEPPEIGLLNHFRSHPS